MQQQSPADHSSEKLHAGPTYHGYACNSCAPFGTTCVASNSGNVCLRGDSGGSELALMVDGGLGVGMGGMMAASSPAAPSTLLADFKEGRVQSNVHITQHILSM